MCVRYGRYRERDRAVQVVTSRLCADAAEVTGSPSDSDDACRAAFTLQPGRLPVVNQCQDFDPSLTRPEVYFTFYFTLLS